MHRGRPESIGPIQERTDPLDRDLNLIIDLPQRVPLNGGTLFAEMADAWEVFPEEIGVGNTFTDGMPMVILR
jgi:hypothetical protein